MSGRIHLGLAQKILDEIHHTVKEFREQQRDIRKKVRLLANIGGSLELTRSVQSKNTFLLSREHRSSLPDWQYALYFRLENFHDEKFHVKKNCPMER